MDGRAIPLLLLLLLGGCAHVPRNVTSQQEPGTAASGRLVGITKRLNPTNWRSKRGVAKAPPSWNWVPALPQDTQRGELVEAIIRRDTLAQLAPDLSTEPIMLASTGGASSAARIVNIAGKKVSNLSEMSMVVDDALESSAACQIDLALSRSGGREEVTATCLEPPKLIELFHQVSPETKVIRVVEEGNPWVLIRDGGVQCKVTARLEQEHGLVQVVVCLRNGSKHEMLLPTDVRAACNGQQLQCLNAAGVLQLLYGDSASAQPSPNIHKTFAEVSEQEDYLVPVNYKQLEQRFAELYQTSAVSLPQPALANVPGQSYPGHALLGDARALTLFMLQRQRVKPGPTEITGWILFADETLKKGGTLELDIRIPNSHRIRWALPETSQH